MKEKIIIRSGGFVVYFFTALIVMFTVIIVGYVRHIHTIIQNEPFSLVGLLLVIWMIAYLIAYIRSNSIEVAENRLNISFVKRSLMSSFLPNVVRKEIELKNIKSIRIASAEALDEANFPMTKYTPLLKIIEKQGKSYIIDTKPFSKKDFYRLMKVLSQAGVPVAYE